LVRQLTVVLVASYAIPAPAQKLPRAELRPESRQVFQQYVREREAGIMKSRIHGGKFLWVDEDSGRRERAKAGEAVVEPGHDRGLVEIKGGMVNDWIGATFFPGTTLAKVLSTIQNYDNHKLFYKPDVIDSRILERNGNQFKVRYRYLKKKMITVVLNSDHEITYFPVDATHQYSKSRTTRVAEVEDAGAPGEHELTPGSDHGLLWNLDTFWRFLERDGGVWIECEAISLTRSIPMGLGWLLTPIVRELPRESLTNTLEGIRRSLR
jgi:hypothetical protein